MSASAAETRRQTKYILGDGTILRLFHDEFIGSIGFAVQDDDELKTMAVIVRASEIYELLDDAKRQGIRIREEHNPAKDDVPGQEQGWRATGTDALF